MTAAALRRLNPRGFELSRFASLTWTLAISEFKLRFYGSLLGVAWTLVRPFAFFAVIYTVFTQILKVGTDVVNYPAYLLLALTLFMYFGEVTGASVSCLLHRENLLRKMRFPRLVIPLSVALTALLNLAMTLTAAVIFLAIIGIYPTWSWLELIPLVALLTMFALGIGLLLSVLFVRYRDVQPIWDVLSQMLFYASPVLYVATHVEGRYLGLYMCNPLATLLTEMRHAVVDPTAAGAGAALGGNVRLAIPLGIIAATFVLGLYVFRREAPRVAENL